MLIQAILNVNEGHASAFLMTLCIGNFNNIFQSIDYKFFRRFKHL